MNLPIKELLIASGNKGKFLEFSRLLKDLPITLKSISDNNIKEPVENGADFFENAEIKARYYYRHYNISSLADDSGIMIDQLNGEPGIYSARWAGANKEFSVAINKIKEKLLAKKIDLNNVTGSFFCALALIVSEDEIIYASGKVDGRIIFPARGDNGFGYDPIFIPKSSNKTYGEISSDEKEKSSHRAKAIKDLIKKIS